MCGEQGRGSPDEVDQFRHRLADLKRNGSNILLVGTDALGAACERLLGESGVSPRYRLFVTADAGPETANRKLEAVGPRPDRDAAGIVNWRTDVRGGTVAEEAGDSFRGARPTGDGEPTVREVTVESDDLRELGETIEEVADAFEAEAGRISPAELRLCFDSLTPLVDDYEGRDVRRFLLGVTETVERFDGMGHYHLPAEYDSAVVSSLAPLFDAVVEVRQHEDGIQQRWHLADLDMSTDWLGL